MRNSTTTNQTTANPGSALNDPDTNKTVLLNATNGKPLGIFRSLLLAAALVGLLPAVQASNWGFTLTGKVTTENVETQDPHEVLQMTGAGKFNPEAGTASGGGAFAVFNGFDELDQLFGGPTFRGTWKVTDFVDWTPDGLEVLVTLFYKVGTNDENKGLMFEEVPVLITEEGIILDFFGLELFSANTSGSVKFHLNKP